MDEILIWIEEHLPVVMTYILIAVQFVQDLFAKGFFNKGNNLLKDIVRNEINAMKDYVKDKGLSFETATNLALEKFNKAMYRVEELERTVKLKQEEIMEQQRAIIKVCNDEIYNNHASDSQKAFATHLLNTIQPKRTESDKEN